MDVKAPSSDTHDLWAMSKEDLIKKVENDRLKTERLQSLPSYEQLHLITDSLPVLISYVDKDLYCRFVNKAYEGWFKKSAEEILGNHIKDILGEAAYEMTRGYRDKVLSGESVSYESLVPFEAGERYIAVSYTPDFDENKNVRGFFVLSRDITKRKRSQSLASGENSVLEKLAAGEPLEVVLTTLVEVIETARPDFICSILLLDETKQRLRSCYARSLPDFYTAAVDGTRVAPGMGSCGTAAFTKKLFVAEDIQTHPNWAKAKKLAARANLRACWSHPVIASDGEVLGTFAIYYRTPKSPSDEDLDIIGMAAHVSGIAIEWKQAEDSLKDALQEADSANQARAAFLANMSHDLRTPLNAIIGFSDALIHGSIAPDFPPKCQEYVSDINVSGKHLLSLVNDILDLSRIEAGKLPLYKDAVDIPELIDHSTHLAKAAATGKDCNIHIETEKNMPPLYGDRVRLNQILLNLLSNAAKFSEKGQNIVVSAGTSNEDAVWISIADSGVGMAKEDIPTAMETFSQVSANPDHTRSGSGLGLPLVRHLMELHGGDVALESELGVGTTVTLRFPADLGESATPT
jgi:PAS domain S-box-containing protein